MSDVYIVTSGTYSDYHIDAVFKNREKAELYCECHDKCEIETWEYGDEDIYSTYDYVFVAANIYIDENTYNIKYTYSKASEEDDPYKKNSTYVMSYAGKEFKRKRAEIYLYRELPKDYSKMQVEQKYEKVIEDLMYELKYEISNYISYMQLDEFVRDRIEEMEVKYEG